MTSTPEKPLISVVIPAFNSGKILAETLESVRAQTFKDFEVVIVDDGSTDDTAAVAQRFCQMDSRFTLIQQSNGGVCAARNTAIERSRGEWIAFLDHDDVWLPEKLERQMDLSRQDPKANLLFTNYTKWNGQRDLQLAYPPEEPLPEGDTIEKLIFRYTYLASAVVVRRQLLLDVGLFDRELNLVEDWDVWLRIAERGIHARGTREPYMRWRRWPGSNLIQHSLETVQKVARMLEKHIAAARRPDLLPLYHRSLIGWRVFHEKIRAVRAMQNDPDAVPEFIKRALSYRWNWQCWWWLVLLKWPKPLGGHATRRKVYQQIRYHWTAKK